MTMLTLEFTRPEVYDAENLYSLIINGMKDKILNKYKCPYCFGNNSGNGKTKYSFHIFSRVLLISLDRRVYDDNKKFQITFIIKMWNIHDI